MNGVVLIVEPDGIVRRRLAAWLGSGGYEIGMCPGPGGTEACVCGGWGPCPQAEEADAVVLDLRLASDDLLEGIPGWELLERYLASGGAVVALYDEGDHVRIAPDERMLLVRRPATKGALLAAVNALVSEGAKNRVHHPVGRG